MPTTPIDLVPFRLAGTDADVAINPLHIVSVESMPVPEGERPVSRIRVSAQHVVSAGSMTLGGMHDYEVEGGFDDVCMTLMGH